MVTYKDRLKKAFPVFKEMLSKPKPFVIQTTIGGGVAGDHTVANIQAGDELVGVIHIGAAAATVTDIKSEFTVVDGKITNVGGTDTTSGFLLITYLAWDAR